MEIKEDSNEITREYLNSLTVEFRQLDCVLPDTTFHFFGHAFSAPIVTAAFSHMQSLHKNAVAEVALGAKEAGCVDFAGFITDEETKALAETKASFVKVVKPFRDHDEIRRQIKEAVQLGAIAVGMDIDHCYSRYGKYDMNGLLGPITSEDIAEFASFSKVPFLVKGVLSVFDALKAKKAGAKGIVVSHHHGIMNCAVPPLRILPSIRKAVGKEMLILADCGISTGGDVFKCLALGADGAMAGRALLGDEFKKRGGAHVASCLKRMTDELRGYLAHTGCASLKDVDPSLVWVPERTS